MKPEWREDRVDPAVARESTVVPLRPQALLYDRTKPCTACRWVRRSVMDRLVGGGDYATCNHPALRDDPGAAAASGAATRCVTLREYLQPCGPAGRYFTPKG